jgi:hypothetical protein
VAESKTTSDLELGAAEGAERSAAGAEEDEPVALGSARLLVGDDTAVLEVVGDGEVDGAAGLVLGGCRFLAVVPGGWLRGCGGGGGGLGRIGFSLLRRHREAN